MNILPTIDDWADNTTAISGYSDPEMPQQNQQINQRKIKTFGGFPHFALRPLPAPTPPPLFFDTH